MKKLLILAFTFSALAIASCGGGDDKNESAETPSEPAQSMLPTKESYDPHRGEGKWTAENIGLAAAPDAAKADAGKKIAEVKCQSCHKMTDERLVGPGWKGVTSRHKPEWIMNFITNPDPMIDKDPKLQAQLELCLVRMPNQSITDDDAKALVEYMRQNDAQ